VSLYDGRDVACAKLVAGAARVIVQPSWLRYLGHVFTHQMVVIFFANRSSHAAKIEGNPMSDFARKICRPRPSDALWKFRPVICTLLVLSCFVSWSPLLRAQAGQAQMSQADYAAYQNATRQTTPEARAAAYETYLAEYPNSVVKIDVQTRLLFQYSTSNTRAEMITTADRLLQLDPDNLRGLTYEVACHHENGDTATDIVRKQEELDQAANLAQRGLAAQKPATISDADFRALQAAAFPIFYSAIGAAALDRKDAATAIAAFKREIAFVPLASTEVPGLVLQDTYYLGVAYYTAPTPDYVDCAFYAARAAIYAPEAYKTNFAALASYCYRKYHGNSEGYEALVATAKANLNPPPGFTIKAAVSQLNHPQ
jgi:hypothetical protein